VYSTISKGVYSTISQRGVQYYLCKEYTGTHLQEPCVVGANPQGKE